MGGGFNINVLKDMWVLDVDRGMWSEVSELIYLFYDELHQECILCVHAVAYIHVTVCLDSFA